MSLRPEANGNIYFCVCLAGGNIYNICITRQTLWFVTIQTTISPMENIQILSDELRPSGNLLTISSKLINITFYPSPSVSVSVCGKSANNCSISQTPDVKRERAKMKVNTSWTRINSLEYFCVLQRQSFFCIVIRLDKLLRTNKNFKNSFWIVKFNTRLKMREKSNWCCGSYCAEEWWLVSDTRHRCYRKNGDTQGGRL